MAKVTLNNVSKSYPADKDAPPVTAVQDFSLAVADREFVVIAGPSGCGKSTVLRMIAGLEKPSLGDIHIGDRHVNDIPPQDRDVAMVFQNRALYPHLTAAENMAFGLKLRNIPHTEIKKRVADTASLLGIEDLLLRKPKTLSGGQRRRVALGRAIVRQPKAFLFDEPLTGLDAGMRAQLRTEISRLHQNLQATMIYVTHDQTEAMTMGTRIAIMNDGTILQADSPLTVYQQPSNLFVAGFLGNPPMSFLKGRLATKDGNILFKESDGGTVNLNLGTKPDAVSATGKDVILGVRPEDCSLVASPSSPPHNAFPAIVDLVEPMGPDIYYHLQTGTHTLVGRGPATDYHAESGRRAMFSITANRTLLFDPDSKTRLA